MNTIKDFLSCSSFYSSLLNFDIDFAHNFLLADFSITVSCIVVFGKFKFSYVSPLIHNISSHLKRFLLSSSTRYFSILQRRLERLSSSNRFLPSLNNVFHQKTFNRHMAIVPVTTFNKFVGFTGGFAEFEVKLDRVMPHKNHDSSQAVIRHIDKGSLKSRPTLQKSSEATDDRYASQLRPPTKRLVGIGSPPSGGERNSVGQLPVKTCTLLRIILSPILTPNRININSSMHPTTGCYKLELFRSKFLNQYIESNTTQAHNVDEFVQLIA